MCDLPRLAFRGKGNPWTYPIRMNQRPARSVASRLPRTSPACHYQAPGGKHARPHLVVFSYCEHLILTLGWKANAGPGRLTAWRGRCRGCWREMLPRTRPCRGRRLDGRLVMQPRADTCACSALNAEVRAQDRGRLLGCNSRPQLLLRRKIMIDHGPRHWVTSHVLRRPFLKTP